MLIDDIINERYPHQIRITRNETFGETDDPFSDSDGYADVLYDGEGRSFTDTTTQGDNNVDTNKRKVSIPVRFDEWESCRIPSDGDAIDVWIGENRETGIVKDCEPDNNRTLVYWDYNRV